jgi:hypothetical protein
MNEAHNDPVIEMKVEIRKKGTRDLDDYGRAQNMILLQVLINLDKLSKLRSLHKGYVFSIANPRAKLKTPYLTLVTWFGLFVRGRARPVLPEAKSEESVILVLARNGHHQNLLVMIEAI